MTTFRDVLAQLRAADLTHLAPRLVDQGVRNIDQMNGLTPEQVLAVAPEQRDLNAFCRLLGRSIPKRTTEIRTRGRRDLPVVTSSTTPPGTRGTRGGTSGLALLHHGNYHPSRSRQSSSRPSRLASSEADTVHQHKSSVWQDSSTLRTPGADSPRTSSSRSPCPSGASSGAWAHQHSRTHSLSRTSQPQRIAPIHHHQRKTTGQSTSTTASS